MAFLNKITTANIYFIPMHNLCLEARIREANTRVSSSVPWWLTMASTARWGGGQCMGQRRDRKLLLVAEDRMHRPQGL